MAHNQWVPQGYFTRRKGRSAWDAAYHRSAEIESVCKGGNVYAGGEGDLDKCYDLMVPGLALCAALAIGIPPIIVAMELSFIRVATYAVRYVGCFGLFKTHLRGLFQGSPLSESWLGASFVPWHQGIMDIGGIPRVLADDFW